MKKIICLAIAAFVLLSCKSSFSTGAPEDDWIVGVVTVVEHPDIGLQYAVVIPKIWLDDGTVLGNGTYMINRSDEEKPYFKLVNARPGTVIEYRVIGTNKFEYR